MTVLYDLKQAFNRIICTDTSTNSRERWIDILRALAMFLVVVGHTYNNKTFYQIINPVKMPLFYFLAGFFLNVNNDFKSYIQGILYRFTVPWLLFSLLPLYVIKYLLIGEVDNALHYIIGFLLGFEVWFVPSFIITQLLCYTIYRFTKNEIVVLSSAFFCFFIGIFLKDVPFFEVWAMNTALTGVFFVILGRIFYNHKDVVIDQFISKQHCFYAALAIYCALAAVSMFFYPQQTMDFHNTVYYNPFICLAMIFTGIICCIHVSIRLRSNFLTRCIAIMGQNTLVVYLINGAVQHKFVKLYRLINGNDNRLSLLISIVITIFVSVICTVVSVVAGKICPILVGKRKK